MGTRQKSLLSVLVVLSASSGFNLAYSTISPNEWCQQNTCQTSSGYCTGSPCDYCAGQDDQKLRCSYKPTYGCGATSLDVCGRVWLNGTCYNNQCSGGYTPIPYELCGVYKCDSTYPPD